MKKNFEQGLRDKLNEIHTQPESHLWEQIEERLTETDFETIIVQKLDEIQKLEPSSVVWSKIEARLQLEGRFSIPSFRNCISSVRNRYSLTIWRTECQFYPLILQWIPSEWKISMLQLFLYLIVHAITNPFGSTRSLPNLNKFL